MDCQTVDADDKQRLQVTLIVQRVLSAGFDYDDGVAEDLPTVARSLRHPDL